MIECRIEKSLPQIALGMGRYELNDGNDFVVSAYEPKLFSRVNEFHEKYVDVQVLIESEDI